MISCPRHHATDTLKNPAVVSDARMTRRKKQIALRVNVDDNVPGSLFAP
jgi:hypothetical protein